MALPGSSKAITMADNLDDAMSFICKEPPAGASEVSLAES